MQAGQFARSGGDRHASAGAHALQVEDAAAVAGELGQMTEAVFLDGIDRAAAGSAIINSPAAARADDSHDFRRLRNDRLDRHGRSRNQRNPGGNDEFPLRNGGSGVVCRPGRGCDETGRAGLCGLPGRVQRHDAERSGHLLQREVKSGGRVAEAHEERALDRLDLPLGRCLSRRGIAKRQHTVLGIEVSAGLRVADAHQNFAGHRLERPLRARRARLDLLCSRCAVVAVQEQRGVGAIADVIGRLLRCGRAGRQGKPATNGNSNNSRRDKAAALESNHRIAPLTPSAK
jgi:hypothetical protein